MNKRVEITLNVQQCALTLYLSDFCLGNHAEELIERAYATWKRDKRIRKRNHGVFALREVFNLLLKNSLNDMAPLCGEALRRNADGLSARFDDCLGNFPIKPMS